MYDIDIAAAGHCEEDQHSEKQTKLGDTEALLQDDLNKVSTGGATIESITAYLVGQVVYLADQLVVISL